MLPTAYLVHMFLSQEYTCATLLKCCLGCCLLDFWKKAQIYKLKCPQKLIIISYMPSESLRSASE